VTEARTADPEVVGTGFYAGLPVFDSFERLTDPAIYTPLPDDWLVGLADVVQSTAAIESGRYKVVNTAAAAVIVAIANTLGDSDFPFVFGGDGASFALPPGDEAAAREVLASTAAWVRDAFGLALRVALVPVSTLRAEGYDVRVARFAPSPDVSYAMFTGGGVAYAERRMKDGAFGVAPGPEGAMPDLNGLSCRFDEIPPEKDVILSLIVTPVPGADPFAFNAFIDEVLALVEASGEATRPVPAGGPPASWPPKGLSIEVKTGPGLPIARRARLLARTLASAILFRTGLKVGSFDPARYIRQLVRNTDFRKFDDGLRMTLDCSLGLADRLEERLAAAERDGIARYGTHRQSAALMTCFVPSPTRSDHIHFVDGAMGGYASAAKVLKGT